MEKERKTRMGRTTAQTKEFKFISSDESTRVVLGAGVMLQWDAVRDLGKDGPPRMGRVEENSVTEERETSH